MKDDRWSATVLTAITLLLAVLTISLFPDGLKVETLWGLMLWFVGVSACAMLTVGAIALTVMAWRDVISGGDR